MGLLTNFINSSGIDIGLNLVEKSYLIDNYPDLANTFKFAGLWLWGQNNYGQLGNNAGGLNLGKSSPVQTVSGGANWKSVALGNASSAAAIKTDGTLWLWGRNTYGQLGDNTRTSRSSPTQTVPGGTNWRLVSGGSPTTSAIKTDGTLWLWGKNQYGELGNNTRTRTSSPIQTVSGGTNWKLVASCEYQSIAIKTDGTLWTWGYNSLGQLGDNTRTSRSSPIQTVAGGTNWKSVDCNHRMAAGIKTDGTLWNWGFNSDGQLGDNSITSKSSPVQTVAGGTNWKSVAVGTSFITGIKTDGTLWLWGRNDNGQLGDNTIVKKSSPVQTVSGGTNWKLVSCCYYWVAGIKTDGTLWLWGNNNYGNLGDNTIVKKSSPVQTVSGGTNWMSVEVGTTITAAIRDNSNDYI